MNTTSEHFEPSSSITWVQCVSGYKLLISSNREIYPHFECVAVRGSRLDHTTIMAALFYDIEGSSRYKTAHFTVHQSAGICDDFLVVHLTRLLAFYSYSTFDISETFTISYPGLFPSLGLTLTCQYPGSDE